MVLNLIVSVPAKYTSNLLTRAGLTDCKIASTPLEPQSCLTPLDDTILSDATLYRQLVDSLVYLTVTRPDIAYAIHILRAFFDADWTGDPTDRRSTTGKKQSLTARSSTEAEYRALADTTQELLWLLADMGVTPSGATDLFL
ncbi:uncharacterized protein LOC114303187 [Camellia sinensis]|uniref:uncharacterized protein LOC114303187 n=1 Tax=Camellia sinensis TaxID=4442 RepID=UPI0010362EAC|nr:uncharacterized protein LOC114303187 [Camellia sinensis]